jgi:penicillin-binding protein 1A
MDDMLRGVVSSGTGARAAIAGYDLAGKTGTTSDYKDAWFCGFTGGFTTVVWVGKDDGSSMVGVTGGTAPATLWRTYMAQALPRIGARSIPPGPPAAAPAPTLAVSAEPAPGQGQDQGGADAGVAASPAPAGGGRDPVSDLLSGAAKPQPPTP